MSQEIKKYVPEHAYQILDKNVRDVDLQLSSYMNWEKQCKIWKYHPSYTLIIDKEIVACGGVMLMEFKRGEAWTLFSNLLYKYPIACVKAANEILDKVVKKYDLIRIQALVKSEHYPSKKFIEYLKFEYEGCLRRYGPDNEDMIMYSRIY